MSGGLFDSGRLTIRIGLLTALAAGLSLGCGTSPGPAVSPVPGLPETAVCPTKGPPTTPAEVKACASKLTFDEDELVGDEQRLMVHPPCPGSCRYGPLAKIEPVKGAQDYSDDEMRQGRIIARLFIRKGDQERYLKLALVPGYMTYWWVQRDAAGRNRSLFISEAAEGTRALTAERPLEVEPYPRGTFTRAIAGWWWLEDDETAKGTCGSASCK
jgi:hypothetical protein